MKRRDISRGTWAGRVRDAVLPSEREAEDRNMKYLLSSVAIVAVVAMVAPAWAQRSGPGAGAGETTGPGVNPPGGPGPSSPLSNLPAGSPGLPGSPQTRGTPPTPAAPGVAPTAAPGMAPGTESTSAYPPTRRHARHYAYKHHHGGPVQPVSGSPNNSANQLNADELARLQSGNYGNPPSSALPYGQAPSSGGPSPYGQAPGPGTPPPAHY